MPNLPPSMSGDLARSRADASRSLPTLVVSRQRPPREVDMPQSKRRDILKLGALAGAATGLGMPTLLRAQPKEIVILGLWDATGAFADVGPLNDRGMRMALEERDMKIL